MIAAILAIGSFAVAVIGTLKDYRSGTGKQSLLGLNHYGVALILIAAVIMVGSIVQEIQASLEARRERNEGKKTEQGLQAQIAQLMAANSTIVGQNIKLKSSVDSLFPIISDVSSKVASIEKQYQESSGRELYRPLRYLAQSVDELQRQAQEAKTIQLVVPDSSVYGGVRSNE